MLDGNTASTDAADTGILPDKSEAPKVDPASSTAGESTIKPSTEAPSKKELPENLKGKSVDDLVEMLANSQKKIGEQSKEVSDARSYKTQMDEVLNYLYSDKELFAKVEKGLAKKRGISVDSEQGSSGDGEEGRSKGDAGPGNDDVRLEVQNRVLSTFQEKFGLDKMSGDKRTDLNKRIAKEFAEIREPGGKKSASQLIKETPVHLLEKLLEKSYWLAVKDSFLDKGGKDSRDMSSIGRLSTSTGKSDSDGGVTAEEAKIAENLGISSEKYAKGKKKLRG